MVFGKGYEFVDVWPDCIDSALHRRDSIRVALKSDSLPHYSSKKHNCGTGCSTTMIAPKITSEDEYIISTESEYEIRGVLCV